MEKYEKIRVVGRGAYGTVHLCCRLSDRKLVIIKQIPVEQMTKEERQAALNEVKVLSMLHHPNIIEYYENFLEDKALMIVMEYAQGGTLLEYLQSRNENLLEEEVLSSKSKAYTVVGTPCYISPELCEGKPYNQKSDIWALGCVLYELASLKRAFEAANLPALILKIMRGTFSPISDQYSEELRSLILSMLHLDPARRPHINQIMACPIIINALINLHTDTGKVACVRVHRPLSNLPGSSRSRTSVRGVGLARDGMVGKPRALSSVLCWGGGLTQPTRLPLPSPDTQVVQVAAGRTQRAAVTKHGRLFVWEPVGMGGEIALPGALDSGHSALIPRYLEGQAAVTIQHVACGDLFTACLTDRGILMTYGSGVHGCLGHGNYSDVTQAKIVEALLGYEVVQVSCGASHVLAVTNEHEIFAWGRGDNAGRLGLGNEESSPAPQPVAVPDDVRPCSVHCGVDCSVIRTLDGALLCCGSNRNNKLALDQITAEGVLERLVEEVHVLTPVASAPISNMQVQVVAVGTSHTAVVNAEGKCYTFGSNQFRQLGFDKEPQDRRPGLLRALTSYSITTVACGDTFTVAVTDAGDIFSWGKSARGRLGRLDDEPGVPKKVAINGEDPFSIVSISCSHGNTLVAIRPILRSGSPIE
ncbi:hypothetical protein C0Q70_17071 [Pomacea canaliculata]|uniref:non-specific serine/threonine protein kinase n=1 Tax=Pomacea canaliculata TaxID=400727 RepID=A0A2T7NRK3_POMCA|nr:hypothetical protein C0Q70_17071 [Pomacea canaliculata]